MGRFVGLLVLFLLCCVFNAYWLGEEGGPVDNDWTFDWYGVEWSEHLDTWDDPDLTAIIIQGGRGSGSLAVHAVELCVQV